MYRVLFLAFLLLPTIFAAPLFQANQDKIDNEYMVILKETATQANVKNHLSKLATLDPNHQILNLYTTVLTGYSVRLSDANLIHTIREEEDVEWVEENSMMHIVDAEQTDSCTMYTNVLPWGLERISEGPNPDLEGVAHFAETSGAGVTAYVVDTGIYIEHNDFEGRAEYGVSYYGSTANDGNGHGTHCAGTIGGVQYGVAKKATLVAVKVLSDSGSGSTANVVAGVDWATNDCNNRNGPCTMNLSLGGGASTTSDQAVNNAWSNGIFVAVAAGNSNANACNYSPARAGLVKTAGATGTDTLNGLLVDVRSTFSNYGTCVNTFAPGSDILSAWIGGPSATRTISGTSMASPHLCGAATLLFGQGTVATNEDVWSVLAEDAVEDVIYLNCGSNTACLASPNELLQTTCVN